MIGFSQSSMLSTSWAASVDVMKYRVTSRLVTVTGPPSAICRWNRGTTLPFEPSTLPKRTITLRVEVSPLHSATRSSTNRFVAPITLIGRTALSVEISTNVRAPAARAASRVAQVPRMLFSTASTRWNSMSGTCLNAAA